MKLISTRQKVEFRRLLKKWKGFVYKSDVDTEKYTSLEEQFGI